MNRLYSYFFYSSLCVTIGIAGSMFFVDKLNIKPKTKQNISPIAIPVTKKLPVETAAAQEDKEIKLLFVGDIMLDRGVLQSANREEAGLDFVFEHAHRLREADITFGNLEGPISDKGKNHGSIYSFRMQPEAAPALARAGFDVLSLANNHAGDWGREALVDTISRLSAQRIAHVGAGDNLKAIETAHIVVAGGLQVGFLAFSDVGPVWMAAQERESGIAIAHSADYVKRVVKKEAQRTDILVVSFHFGGEYKKTPGAREREIAEAAVDAGAKIVIGHHPHVVQPVDSYKGSIIAYSLGNFVFDQNFSEDTMGGGALEVYIKNGKLRRFKLHEFEINGRFQPMLDSAY